MHASSLHIFLLGAVRLHLDEQPYKFAVLPKTPSLLAYLLIHRKRLIEREQVAFTLWSDGSELDARANLRRHLYDLKRALPPGISWFRSDAETVQWNLDTPFTLDLEEFERLTNNDHPDATPEAQTVLRLSSAVELYQEDLCTTLYDDWIVPERERLRNKYISVLESLIETSQRTQNVRAALQYTERLVRCDPIREETFRQWMRLLAQSGNRAGVVHAYNLCVSTLERELDVEPARETRELYEQLVRQNSGPAQLSGRAQNNLPNPLTPVLGRATERAAILASLHDARLVTLTGTGGVGKTRLALDVAHSLLPEFADSVWFLDLAAVTGGEHIVSHLTETLGIIETTNRPLRTVLLQTLRERQTLLVFDNCEHVIDAATKLAHEILTQSTALKILATSREPLHLPGERVIAIAPLTVPRRNEDSDPDTALVSPSMQLLISRAQSALPTFQVTAGNAPALARICRTVEGIPLALELAAAYLSVLSPEELAARLEIQLYFLGGSNRIAPARQQTLQATFDWSFGALSLPQQVLLTRLSIFNANFTLTAAERVCGYTPLDQALVLALLSNLIEKSLIVVSPVNGTLRYGMLNVTHQFAVARLGNRTAVLRKQLLAYYVEQVEHYASFFHESRQIEAYAWVHDEYGNVRTALEIAWSMELAQELARLCGALWTYWWTRGQLTEGRVWLDRALSHGDNLSSIQRAALLNGAGRLAVLQDDYVRARPLLQEHLALRRALGDPAGIGDALNSLGAFYYHVGEIPAASATWQESLELSRALDHKGFTARALSNLGDLAVTHGDIADGFALLEASLALFRQLGASRGESIVMINLGTAALQANDVPRARVAFRDSLVLKVAIQDQDGIAWTLEGLAVVAARENDWERALQLMGAAAQQRARLGIPTPIFFVPLLDQIRRDAFPRLGKDRLNTLLEQGRSFPLEHAIALAMQEA